MTALVMVINIIQFEIPRNDGYFRISTKKRTQILGKKWPRKADYVIKRNRSLNIKKAIKQIRSVNTEN